MAKGQTYNYERIPRVDPITGTRYMQLTSFPTISMNLWYYYGTPTNGFTPDSQALVFLGKRSGEGPSPWDIFTVGVDGTGFIQLTEREGIGGVAVSSTKPVVYFHRNGTLWSVDRNSSEESEISHFEAKLVEEERVLHARLSADEGFYFFQVIDPTGKEVVVRHATDSSGAVAIGSVDEMRIHSIDPAGKGIFVSLKEGDRWVLWLVDYDGVRIARYGENVFAHQCPLGATGTLVGCAQWPEHSLSLLAPGQEKPEVIHRGPYYWHASASLDGQWIVADSNWPNEGLFLVNVATRRSEVLLHPHNTGAEPQWTHAHPFFSPDMNNVAFNSDASGTAQVCIAKIPEELLARLAAP